MPAGSTSSGRGRKRRNTTDRRFINERSNEFYLKSEADKVIAEKDAEIAELQKQVHDYAQGLYVIQARAEKELRHTNYKRCLAMAERCKYRMYYLAAVVEQEASKIVPSKAQIRWYEKRERRMDYWKNRWLELAEKFKEMKQWNA